MPPSSVKAGVFYFAVVFAAGFVFGTFRTLVLVPRLGERTAVLVELPIILAVSWIACGRAIRRCRVPDRAAPRLVMGIVAFGLLMIAELGLSMLVFGRSFREVAADLGTPQGWLGLAGQVAFALFPLARIKRAT
jgi:hypothetical protein